MTNYTTTETPILREDLWDAWVERGRKQNRAGANRLRIAANVIAGAVAVAVAVFTVFGHTGA